MSKLFAIFTFGIILLLGSCQDPYGVAAKAAQDVAVINQNGAKTIDSLRIAGAITVPEERSALGFVSSIAAVNEAYIGCVKAAHLSGAKAAGFGACAQSFVASVSDPRLLAKLHIVNLNSQNEVAAIAQSALASVNAVILAEQSLTAKGK